MSNATTPSSPRTTMNSTTLRMNILYASPPDSSSGDDASESYASRASEIFLKSYNSNNDDNNHANNSATKITVGYIGPLVVNEWYSGENDGGLLPWYIIHDNDNSNTGNENVMDVTVFLISCTADGSVNRSVRQVTKKLKKYSTQSTTTGSETTRTTNNSAATTTNYVGLLGHARCDNSAKQMADTIFGTGRRFPKALAHCYDVGRQQLETQVELVGPEQDFDPWVKSIMGDFLLISAA